MKSTFYQQFYAEISSPFQSKKGLINAFVFIEKTLVGVSAAAYLFTAIYALFGLGITKERLTAVLLLPAACFLTVTLLQKLCKRHRPYEKGVQSLVKKNASENSFPSRHTACAFVIAATLFPYFPLASGVLLAVGVWITFFRFLFGHHYFTDLVFGAALGILFGAIGWL